MFISHTSELRDFPQGNSYVAAVERAINAAGHVVVDMADFAVADQPPAQVCVDRVQSCDVYVLRSAAPAGLVTCPLAEPQVSAVHTGGVGSIG